MPRPTNRTVTITVANNKPVCAPDSVDMTGCTSPATITFSITPNGYSFPATAPYGIAITDPGTEFPIFDRQSATTLVITDNNNDGVNRNYCVTLDTGSGTISSDPMILNR